MTSNQVKNLFGTQNANWMSSVQPAGKTESVDFKSFMKNSEENLKAVEVKTASAKKEKTVDKQAEDTTKDEIKTVGSNNVHKNDRADVDRVPAEDEIEAVKETVEAIKDAVKEALNISDEQLEEALKNLGLNVMALLIPENIMAVAVEATGEENVISLVTNEGLYDKVKNLTAEAETITAELAEKLNIDPEEFNKAIVESQSIQNEETVENVLAQPTETGKNIPVKGKDDSEGKTETKITFENETLETRELKNFSVQTKNETSEENLSSETERSNGAQESDERITETPNSFVQNLVEKTQQTLNSVEETANYSAEETKQIMDQMTESIKVQVKLDTTEISIRLHPESLGNVNVKVSANSEGTMTAQFTAENESVKAVLETQAVVLRETLEAKGITVEAVEVMVASHEFNEDLSERQNRDESGESKKSSTRRISLEDLNEQEELTEEENLQKEMMQQNGNTIDYTA